MKKLFTLIAATLTATVAFSVSAEPQISGHGFTDGATFRLMTSGAGDVEFSNDLLTWSKYATVTQPTGLEDLGSRGADHRFYRVHGGSDVVGYIKIFIPAGKMAIVGNSFAAPLRLDTPDARHAVFGITNPLVKVSLYTNGNFVVHSLDPASGTWTPPLRPIRPGEGFSVQNAGHGSLAARISGPVHMGRSVTTIPAGPSLVPSPLPGTSTAAEWLASLGHDGTQVNWFDDQTQTFQVSTFDALEKPGKWMPKAPTLELGRAVIVKAPQPITLTNNIPALSAR